jgi:hypothetical protein
MSTDSSCTDDDCSFAVRMRSLHPNFYACRDEEADADDAAGSDECKDEANDSSFDSNVSGNIEDEEELPATAEVPPYALNIVPRGHRLHLPRTGRLITHLLADDLWQWEPNVNAIRGTGCIQLMTDYTLAAHKAVRQLWGGDVDYLFAMCAFHTWSQWKKKHIGLFRDAASNAPLCRTDFEAYRCSPWPALIPIIILKMVEKWAHVYNEPTVAFAWWKQWARTIHNLAMINDRGLFRGGLPGTNNNSESLNLKDKVAFDHRCPVTAEFIENLMDEMWKRSVQDLQFTADILKSKVHSKKFYRSIHKTREKAKRNEATFLNVGFAFSRPPAGVPTGSTLVASNEFLYDKNELMSFIS